MVFGFIGAVLLAGFMNNGDRSYALLIGGYTLFGFACAGLADSLLETVVKKLRGIHEK